MAAFKALISASKHLRIVCLESVVLEHVSKWQGRMILVNGASLHYYCFETFEKSMILHWGVICLIWGWEITEQVSSF